MPLVNPFYFDLSFSLKFLLYPKVKQQNLQVIFSPCIHDKVFIDLREKYQDTPGSSLIYQNAPGSSKITNLPLYPKKYTL